MSRCQHCNKLTHSEDLVVEYKIEDHGKVHELMSLKDWVPAYLYRNKDGHHSEFGKLKCGDIWIHFLCKKVDFEK